MTSSDRDVEVRALALFERALDVASGKRRDFIIEKSDGDPALRERALALLDADDGVRMVQTGGAFVAADIEDAPSRIGAYKVIRLIGRGGMGAVYLGERDAGDFSHRVAIKLVRGFAADTRRVERIRAERETLAGLVHPNIAQLHDGGETQDGSPYFIMEYVDGAPLVEILEDGELSRDELLSVFHAVCEAVEFAHQKLIVHRDLSPSNIMITHEKRVKLIDFGISRSVSDKEKGPNSTMTRGYAAPERERGEAATTLGDIYSLGVILRDIADATDERKSDDLDAIIEKAAAENPEDRYDSVGALIADIQNYRHGAPVSARGDDFTYVAGKFIARHRLAVTAAALGFVALVSGLVITSSLYRQAEAERIEADNRFNEVRELASFMLFDLYDQLTTIPGTTLALENIADRSRLYLDELSASKRSSTPLKIEAAIGYRRLGDVVGNPIGANLGRREEADAHLAKALNDLEAIVAADPDNIEARRALGEAAYSRAVFEFIAIDDNETAIRFANLAEEQFNKVVESGEATSADRMRKIDAKAQGAKPYSWIGEGEKGIAILEEVVDEAEDLLDQYPDETQIIRAAAVMNVTLAESMTLHYDVEGGDYTKTFPHFDRALSLFERAAESDPEDSSARRNLPSAYFKRSLVHTSLEDHEAELADLKAGEAIAMDFLSKDPADLGMGRILASIHEQMAMSYSALGRHAEAIALADAALAKQRQALAEEPDNPGRYREATHLAFMMGELYLAAERKDEACALFRQSRTGWDEIEKRWEVSDYDRELAINVVDEYLTDCA